MPRCPGCFVLLTNTSYGGVTVKTCSSCFGTWISRVSLVHIVRTVEPPDSGAPQPSMKDLAALVTEGDNKRAYPCPECRAVMSMDRLHPMILIDMQFCLKCGYGWLDVGKLALAQRLYHALASSTDPKIIEIRERYALALLGMEEQKERLQSIADAAARLRSPYGTGKLGLNTLLQMLEV